MAIAPAGTTVHGTSTSTTAATATKTVTAGDAVIILCTVHQNASVATPTTSGTASLGSLSALGSIQGGTKSTTYDNLAFFGAVVTSSGSLTVANTAPGGANSIAIQEWSGVSDAPFDPIGGSATIASTTPSVTASGATGVAGEVAVAGLSAYNQTTAAESITTGSCVPTTGWTADAGANSAAFTSGTGFALAYCLGLASGTTPKCQWLQASATWAAALVVLKPTSTPSPPSGVSVSNDNGALRVAWNQPASTGGSPITDFKVYVKKTSDNSIVTTYDVGSAGVTSALVTGLTNGVQVYVQMSAVNAIGEGVLSGASGSFTPSTAPHYFSYAENSGDPISSLASGSNVAVSFTTFLDFLTNQSSIYQNDTLAVVVMGPSLAASSVTLTATNWTVSSPQLFGDASNGFLVFLATYTGTTVLTAQSFTLTNNSGTNFGEIAVFAFQFDDITTYSISSTASVGGTSITASTTTTTQTLTTGAVAVNDLLLSVATIVNLNSPNLLTANAAPFTREMSNVKAAAGSPVGSASYAVATSATTYSASTICALGSGVAPPDFNSAVIAIVASSGPASYTLSVTENVAHAQSWDDSVSALDSYLRAPGAESVSHAAGWDDAAVEVATRSRLVTEAIAHAQGWDESVVRLISAFRVTTESVAHAQGWDDAAARFVTVYKLLTENVGVGQGWDASVVRVYTGHRAVTENVGVGQGWDASAARVPIVFLRAVSEPSLAGDSAVAHKQLIRAVTENVAVSLGYDASAARAPLLLVRSLTESIAMALGYDASAARLIRAVRAVNEPSSFGDSALVAKNFSRPVTESVAVGQGWDASVVRAALNLTRALTENIAAGLGYDASAASRMSALRVVTEAALAGDQAARFVLARRVVTELVAFALGVDATVARTPLTLTRSAVESIGVALGYDASVTRRYSAFVSFSEAALFGDAIARRLFAFRTASEPSLAGDAVTLGGTHIVSHTESVAVGLGLDASALRAPLALLRQITENVGIGLGFDATAAKVVIVTRARTETGLPGDVAALRLSVFRAVAEAAFFGDAATLGGSHVIAITETMGVARAWDATAARTISTQRAVAESVAFALGAEPLAAVRAAVFRSVVESGLPSDAVTARLFASRSASVALAAALGLDATVVRRAALARLLTENIGAASGLDAAVQRAPLLLTRAVTESGAPGDATSMLRTVSIAHAESIAAASGWLDSVSRQAFATRVIMEAVAEASAWTASVDVIKHVGTYYLAITETTMTSDLVAVVFMPLHPPLVHTLTTSGGIGTLLETAGRGGLVEPPSADTLSTRGDTGTLVTSH